MRRDEEASQREKDRREEMDLLRSLVESSRPTTLSAGGAGEEGAARTVPAHENVVLAKFAEGDDVDVFLTTFERVMNGYKIPEGRWAIQLAPQLSGKAQQAYASLSAEAAANYQEVKKAILRRYDVCEETYRQRFLSARKREQETYTGLANRLGDLASKWLAQCDSVPSVIEKMLMEQLLEGMPTELRVWLCERKPKSVADIGTWADDYQTARRRKSGETSRASSRGREQADRGVRICHACRKEGHLAASCPEKHQSQPLGRPNRLDPRKCFNCQERDHIALHCPKPRSNPNLYCERVGGRTQGGREVVGQGALGGVAAGTGSRFNRCEEERYEVQGGMLVGRGDPREGEPMSTVVCAGCTVGMECRSLIHNPEGVRRTGRVEGVLVDDIILDTGCSQTMVHKHLVPKAKLVAEATTSLRCAHGDVVVYPHAEVRVEVDGIVIDVRAAVSERLPTSMILGTDAPTLQLLRSRPMVGEAFVLTWAQVRQQAEVEHVARHKEEESQTRPSPLDQGEGDDRVQVPGIDDMPLLCLDVDLFEIPRERSRKTRREKRQARRQYGLIRAKERKGRTEQPEGILTIDCEGMRGYAGGG